MPSEYKKQFNPGEWINSGQQSNNAGDQRLESNYVLTDEIILAVNVAMVTNRPLLIKGPSGTGKSTLARSVAHVLGSPFYEEVITSDTQASDLMYKVDYLNRLHDAQSGQGQNAKDISNYISPGPLWQAFDSKSADVQQHKLQPLGPRSLPSEQDRCERAVVLIDEIDKANPDVPNNLLVAMGSLFFNVKELDQQVYAKKELAPLIFITTNEERDLPLPFQRRCLELNIGYPGLARMTKIAQAHFDKSIEGTGEAFQRVIGAMLDYTQPLERQINIEVSPAEIIDAITAYRVLEIEADSDQWFTMLDNVGLKSKKRTKR
jgi:MoxR-like ATPase